MTDVDWIDCDSEQYLEHFNYEENESTMLNTIISVD